MLTPLLRKPYDFFSSLKGLAMDHRSYYPDRKLCIKPEENDMAFALISRCWPTRSLHQSASDEEKHFLE